MDLKKKEKGKLFDELFDNTPSPLSKYFYFLVKSCFFPINVNFELKQISFSFFSLRMLVFLFMFGTTMCVSLLGLYISCGIENYLKAK